MSTMNNSILGVGDIYTKCSTSTDTFSVINTAMGWQNTLSMDNNLTGNSLKVTGNAVFEEDVTIKGKSILSALDNIEKRLAILHPNPELEEKWERLKTLGRLYRELEAEIIEKEHVWSSLKK